MKANLTYIHNLLPLLKLAQAFIHQRSLAAQQLVVSAISYLLSINFSWVKIGNYVFSALREAFRDNVLSEIEMEFLLLTATGFVIAAKSTIATYISNLKTQHPAY